MWPACIINHTPLFVGSSPHTQALAEARKPEDISLLAELREPLPALLTDTTRAYVRGAWRPAVQVRACVLFDCLCVCYAMPPPRLNHVASIHTRYTHTHTYTHTLKHAHCVLLLLLQGAASLVAGQLDFLLQRRLLNDDFRGTSV